MELKKMEGWNYLMSQYILNTSLFFFSPNIAYKLSVLTSDMSEFLRTHKHYPLHKDM